MIIADHQPNSLFQSCTRQRKRSKLNYFTDFIEFKPNDCEFKDEIIGVAQICFFQKNFCSSPLLNLLLNIYDQLCKPLHASADSKSRGIAKSLADPIAIIGGSK